jgi:amidase
MPSAANSLSGIKPTWGRVSRHGLIHLAESLDHIGPMARTVADAAAILQVIAGADKSDPTALSVPVPNFMKELGGGLTDVVVGVDWDFAGSGAPDALTQAVDHAVSALESLGARVREVKVPDTDAVSSLILPMMMAEVAAAHADYFPGNADRYGPRLRGMVEGARQLDTLSVVRAYQARARFNGALDAVFRDIDILVTPGIGMILPTWDEVEAMSDDMDLMSRTLMKFTLPFNLSGAPTLSLPGGFTHDGLPIGLQFIAKRQQEGQLVRAGHAYQSVTDFHTRHPIP